MNRGPVDHEWLSAHLDGELAADETSRLLDAVGSDADLADELDAIARVRTQLRDSSVEVPAGVRARVMESVASADDVAPVVSLASRRRVPTFAAVAAAVVIIASVVGGVGGTNSLPAVGDLVSQHEAAAAVAIDGAPMSEELADMEEMAMERAMTAGPPMPSEFSMQHAFVDGPTLHLMYVGEDGEPLSVFRHEGEADLVAMGIDGAEQDEMWSGRRADAHVVVVDGAGYVWIMVSQKPHDSMMDSMMDELPTRSASWGDRFRETADLAVAPFRFGT